MKNWLKYRFSDIARVDLGILWAMVHICWQSLLGHVVRCISVGEVRHWEQRWWAVSSRGRVMLGVGDGILGLGSGAAVGWGYGLHRQW